MKKLLALLFALLLAQPATAEVRHSQAEIDRLLAPIALYPDALLAQVLMAATYPLEVVEAARWSRARPGLQGDEAVRAAQDRDWDPSVKSLLAFPHLLQRMDEQLEWTRELGEAFLAQEGEVMDTVQQLRRKAQAAGHLLPDERVRIVDDGRTVIVEYANPRVVYVPYYDPWVVYGAWWWPAYPPYAWAPWPGYVVVRSGITWGTSVGVSVGFFFGAFDWPRRYVKVVHVHNYYTRPVAVRRHATVRHPVETGRWQHRPVQRRGAIAHRADVQPRFDAAPAVRRIEQRDQQRGETRARAQAAPREHAMPPALRASPPPRAAGSQSPAQAAGRLPYDRAHGSPARPVDRADRVGSPRANAAQHRAAQPHSVPGYARRDAGAVPVRPAVRPGMAGDRPRMAR